MLSLVCLATFLPAADPPPFSPDLFQGRKQTVARVDSPVFPFTPAVAQQHQARIAEAYGLPVEFVNDLGMVFRLVPPGSFQMGSPEDEPGRGNGGEDETLHEVTLTRPFYLARCETTVGQFRRFVEETKYQTDIERTGGGNAHDDQAVWKLRPGTSWLKPGYAGPYRQEPTHAVSQVSHTDCREFCRWLQQRMFSGAAAELKFTVALPTESEWEWACRAGSQQRFWWGAEEDTTGQVANVGDRSLQRTHPAWPRVVMPMDDGRPFVAPVGSYRPNPFGLCDMLGNVWEFCGTRHGSFPRQPSRDPGDLGTKESYSVRGGGWSNEPRDARCATRNSDPPHFGHSNLGFRVAIHF